MNSKQEIVENWLPRYTGVPLEEFGQYIILTNFKDYVQHFAEMMGAEIKGLDRPMQSATKDNISIINFQMGSAMAATIMDLLTAIMPKAVLFLGKTGSLKSYIGLGELILPIAAIRGEGTSNDYFPPEVPALPAFNLEKAISISNPRSDGADRCAPYVIMFIETGGSRQIREGHRPIILNLEYESHRIFKRY